MIKLDKDRNVTQEYLDYVSNLERQDLEKFYIGADLLVDRLNKENELLKSNPNFVYAMRNNKAIEYIKDNCITSETWEDLGFCQFIPIGKIKYKALSSKKVQELLDILKG